jgi:hypothetical protein
VPSAEPGKAGGAILQSSYFRFCTSDFRRNADWPEPILPCVAGDGVSARKTQTASSGLCGILVFRAGGPKKRGFGARARRVFGTWHVAVWISGARTRGTAGTWAGEAEGLVFELRPPNFRRAAGGTFWTNEANLPGRPGRGEGKGAKQANFPARLAARTIKANSRRAQQRPRRFPPPPLDPPASALRQRRLF